METPKETSLVCPFVDPKIPSQEPPFIEAGESQLSRFIDEAREAQFRLQGPATAIVLEKG